MTACPNDTNGDGNCGRRWCPNCTLRAWHPNDLENDPELLRHELDSCRAEIARLAQVLRDAYGNGYAAGYDTGRSDGWDEGNDRGLQDGYENGYSDGHEAGYTEGRDEGYEEGSGDGYEQGRYDESAL